MVDYDDLMRLSTILDNNRTPKQTKVITGSRMIDTRTIQAGRVMYIGSELESLVRAAILETGATSKAQMGLVMKAAQAKAAGRADGRSISALVNSLLPA